MQHALLDIPDCLVDVELCWQFLLPPVKGSQVTLVTSNQNVAAILGVVETIRTKGVQVQVKELQQKERVTPHFFPKAQQYLIAA